MKNQTKLIVAALALSFAAASAAKAAGLSWYDSDTRNNSASTVDAYSLDGDGSLKYSTGNNPVAPANKVAVTFYKADPSGTGTPAGGVLGTLGTLNQLSFDWRVNGSSGVAPALRLKLSPNGTSSATYVDLVWEPVYNSSSTAGDTWHDDVNAFAGTQWWQRSNGANHDGYPDFQTLSAFAGGYTPTFNGAGVTLNANTPIYGVEVSMGSGLPNNFEAYVDDVRIGFSTGDSFATNIVAPEPATLSVACAALGLLGRRRRTA